MHNLLEFWEQRFRWFAGGLALAFAGLTAALSLTSPGAPVSSSTCRAAARAAFTTDLPAPASHQPQQNPNQQKADQAAVDSAKAVLTSLDAQQSQVDAAQGAAQKAADAAAQAQQTLDASSDSAMQSAVSSAQSDVDLAQSQVDSDQNEVSSDQALLDSSSSYGGDTSYEQQWLTSAQQTLATDQQKLQSAQQALAQAQSKASDAAANRQQQQQRADALASEAAGLQQKAQDAASNLAAKREAAQQTLDSATQTQQQHHDDFVVRLAAWTHQHRLDVASVTAHNAVLGDCRSAARRSLSVALGFAVLAIGFAVAAVLHERRMRFARVTAIGAGLVTAGRFAARPVVRLHHRIRGSKGSHR